MDEITKRTIDLAERLYMRRAVFYTDLNFDLEDEQLEKLAHRCLDVASAFMDAVYGELEIGLDDGEDSAAGLPAAETITYPAEVSAQEESA